MDERQQPLKNLEGFLSEEDRDYFVSFADLCVDSGLKKLDFTPDVVFLENDNLIDRPTAEALKYVLEKTLLRHSYNGRPQVVIGRKGESNGRDYYGKEIYCVNFDQYNHSRPGLSPMKVPKVHVRFLIVSPERYGTPLVPVEEYVKQFDD